MRFAKQAAADLSANQGGGLVLAGRALPPETHALVHWINAQLQAPIDTDRTRRSHRRRPRGRARLPIWRAISMPAPSISSS